MTGILTAGLRNAHLQQFFAIRNGMHLNAAETNLAKAQYTAGRRIAIPPGLQNAFTSTWAKGLPVIGTGIATLSTGNDINNRGESPAQAIASNGTGLVASTVTTAALTGAAIGSAFPVAGTLAGALIGTGVGAVTSFLVDNNWQWIESTAKDVGNAINNFGEKAFPAPKHLPSFPNAYGMK